MSRHRALCQAVTGGLLALGFTTRANDATAKPPTRHAEWANHSALPIAPTQVEVGVLSDAAWGATEHLELSAQPLLFIALPHAEGKLRWWDGNAWQLSTRLRVSYVTPFLRWVEKEGTLGLLPPGTRVPEALLLDPELLASHEWTAGHWVTSNLATSIAPRHDSMPVLLDFPFLYQRFAALHTAWVPSVGVGALGGEPGWLRYEATVRHRWLRLTMPRDATATDAELAVHVHPGRNHRLSAAVLWSHALLPVGQRDHWLPYLDYRIAFR